MEYDLTEVMEWLLTKGYVIVHKSNPKFTALFHKTFSGIEKGLTEKGTVIEPGVPEIVALVKSSPMPVQQKFSSYKYDEWVHFYMQFIMEAKVPRRIVSASGDPYDTNKYSEDGMKAFQKALKSGFDYTLLVRTIMLYYKSSTKYKKAVGNYLNAGDWRTDYQALAEAATSGTDELAEHIKTETKNAEHNNYTLG